MSFSESHLENAVLELLTEQLGYTHYYGPDVTRDYQNPLFEDDLLYSLETINPEKPSEAIKEALYKLKNIETGSLVQRNETFMDYLQNGIEVSYYNGKEQLSTIINLIDYENVERNRFCVANQSTFVEKSEKRPDIVLFVNGLPLVVVELKSPSREQTDNSEAYRQIRNYLLEIPSFFVYNAFCILSDMSCSKAGTITAGEDRFMEWKTTDGSYENTQFAAFDVLFEGMLEKSRLLDIIKNFICFSKEDTQSVKILTAYHQYFAVKKAIASTVEATQTNGKAGVFWHTQGSGKSLSMVFYAQLLQQALSNPTIVVITDRNDLDEQLFGQFARCAPFLRQIPQQAESREDLKKMLAGREANGIFFTTMQKFEEADEALSLRRNIIVMADEAHRSQYGFEEKIDPVTGKVSIGTARIIRDNLPNATFIGFTGTPIASRDRNTREVFGDYIDVYDMTQAVEDGATRPVYYESRVINIKLDQQLLEEIDKEYDMVAEEAPEYLVQKSKQALGKMDSLLGAPETIDSLCDDIISHYENYRQFELTGKAMIVAYSRPIGIEIYKTILEKRPEWGEKVKVVMTSTNNDPEEWHDIIGNKTYRKELARKFKDNDDPMKIAIVVDMWLTGFDVPSLATMYVYKPMSGHNLMQAIARVNRVFGEKEGGLVVDYVGIAKALKQAMSDYTVRDKNNYGDTNISETALPKFREKLEVCQDLLHGYEFENFQFESDYNRAKLISGAVNFLCSPNKEEQKQAFLKEALLLRQSLTLCRSLLNEKERYLAAFFEAVRTLLNRIGGKGKLSFKEINERINELLKQSIKSQGVINLFSDVKEEFSLFDPKFLEDISRMKERNLAIELLKKLLAEQITVYNRTNVVQSEKFSEMMSRVMSNYLKGLLTNEEVIQELLKMAHDIAQAEKGGNDLGLSKEEKAFYDALTKPSAVKDFYNNDELIAITKELTDALRSNRTIDWQKKEGARAGMRRLVKRLLKKYNYPPEGVEDALQTVIRQCEMWADE